MNTRTKTWTRVLVVGVISAIGAGSALAQNAQPNGQAGPQQVAPQQGIVQQAAPQQGGQQATTVTTGAQTQVSATVTEGSIGLADIGICTGKRFDCNHVISLLLKRRHDKAFGGGIVKAAPIVHHGPYGDHVIQHQLSDLQLVSVCLADPGDTQNAPTYSITLTNHGKVDLHHFKISAVAVLGEIHEFSPTTTIKVDKICAGATLTLDVQMPFACQSMTNKGHRCQFDTLIVAIDAFDQIVECNELNNILILKRTAITVIESKTEGVVE